MQTQTCVSFTCELHFLTMAASDDSHVSVQFQFIHIYLCIYNKVTEQHIQYNSKSLDVVQSLYFGSKLPSSGTYK